eukprot:1183263-Prorocentrum_minimum.AAC.1
MSQQLYRPASRTYARDRLCLQSPRRGSTGVKRGSGGGLEGPGGGPEGVWRGSGGDLEEVRRGAHLRQFPLHQRDRLQQERRGVEQSGPCGEASANGGLGVEDVDGGGGRRDGPEFFAIFEKVRDGKPMAFKEHLGANGGFGGGQKHELLGVVPVGELPEVARELVEGDADGEVEPLPQEGVPAADVQQGPLQSLQHGEREFHALGRLRWACGRGRGGMRLWYAMVRARAFSVRLALRDVAAAA